jgi:hypothetical protein
MLSGIISEQPVYLNLHSQLDGKMQHAPIAVRPATKVFIPNQLINSMQQGRWVRQTGQMSI